MLLYVTRFFNALRREEDGQDLLEYALLVALIAIVAVTAVDGGRRESRRDLRPDRQRSSAVTSADTQSHRVRVRRLADPHTFDILFRRAHDFAAIG